MILLTNDSKQNLSTIWEVSEKIFKNYPAVAQLTFAQAVLESNLDGKISSLALKYNNLFGIKWPTQPDTIKKAKQYGKPVLLTTFEEVKGKNVKQQAKFIYFNSLEDCLEYRKYMLSWSRYKKVYEADNLEQAATEMQRGGYATDSKYVKKLLLRYKKVRTSF